MSVNVAIVGASGYTGYWLMHLLLRHPEADIVYLASAREELPNIADEFPELLGRCDMDCQPIDPDAMAEVADVAVVCLPHKSAMENVSGLLEAGLRVIDLSADYRFDDPDIYEEHYHTEHTDVDNLEGAVYGLPEYFADEIPEADLVANPGCYPTAAVLGIAPLLERGLVEPTGIICNAISGVSGAGRAPKPQYHFPDMNESFMPYSVGAHRHQPEIDQILSRIGETDASVLFAAHLAPFDRGLLQSIYLDPVDENITEDEVLDAFADAYGDAPFVRVRTTLPNVKHVRDTNYCDITARVSVGKVCVFSAIDNMIKGASGQAIQNMNLMFDLDEATGLI